MPERKQLPLQFDGPPIALPGDGSNPDRAESMKPERRFPLQAGRMRQVYGPGDGATCGSCCNYAGRRQGCRALTEGGSTSPGWEREWPACGAYNIDGAGARRRLRFERTDEAKAGRR